MPGKLYKYIVNTSKYFYVALIQFSPTKVSKNCLKKSIHSTITFILNSSALVR